MEPVGGSLKPAQLSSQLLLGAMGTGAAVYGLTSIVAGHSGFALVAAGAAVPACVAATGEWGGLDHRVTLLLHVAAAVVGISLVSHAGPGALVHGLSSGWAQLLSVAVPVPAAPVYLVPMAVVCWATGVLTAETIVHAAAPAVAALPAVVAAVVIRVLIGRSPAPAEAGTIVVMSFALLALMALRSEAVAGTARGFRPLASRVGFIAPAALVAILAGSLAGPALSHQSPRPQPFDPRSLRDQPPLQPADGNPLAEVRAAQLRPDDPWLTVTTSAERGSPALYLRLVVLDQYDGRVWTSGGRYQVAGQDLPAPPTTGPPRQHVMQDITVDAFSGPWVPAADRAVKVTGAQVLVDPADGALVLAAQSAAQTGVHLHVDSLVPTFDPTGLTSAVADRSAALAGDRLVPRNLPLIFGATARSTIAATTGGDFAKLAALQAFFTNGFSVNAQEAGGQSVAQLTAFLAPDQHVGASAEQFAAAFAIMAREMGYATRVVVGFRPFSSGGTRVLHRGDMHAWPEVAFAGLGWVPFEPTPIDQNKPITEQHPVPADTPGATAGKVAGGDTVVGPAPGQTGGGHGPGGASGSLSKWSTLLLIPLVLILLVVALLGVSVGVKAMRRRRRRGAAGPEQRILGAWSEALDRLSERGLQREPTKTGRDVATEARATLGEQAHPPVRHLAELATFSVCAPPDAVTMQHADEAWHDLDGLTGALHESALRRFRCAVDPRPLMRRQARTRAGPRTRAGR